MGRPPGTSTGPRNFIPPADRIGIQVRKLKRELDEANERNREGARNLATVQSLTRRYLEMQAKWVAEQERQGWARAVSR